jgi:hypothetical protein
LIREYHELGEEKLIEEMVKEAVERMQPQDGRIRRGQCAKATGMRGVFTIRNDVPEDVRHGDFQFSLLLCVAAVVVIGVLLAAPLVGIVDIVHDELYGKRYLPSVTDTDLDRMARNALREKQSVSK